MAYQGSWDFVVCDGSGNALDNLIHHQGTSLTFSRNGVPECQLSLSHDDPECATILTAMAQGTGGGMPTLKAYRTGRDGTKTLRFNGYLATISEESGTEASTATFTFRGPFGRLMGEESNRGRFIGVLGGPSTFNGTFTATDAGAIASQLLNYTNTLAPTGVVVGTIAASKNRDRQYAMGQNVGEQIVNLTNVLDGFDFEVTPVDQGTTLGLLNVYASQGSDRPGAKFEYGPSTLANCSGLHRQTLPPVNFVRVIGAGNLLSEKSDAASVAKYGRFEYETQATDVSEQQTLDDKAYALLRPNPVKTLDFTPDPRLAPSPWDDYWIGDRVQFYANRGALVEGPLSVRVNQINIVIDPDTGLETSEIPNPETPDEEATIRASLQTEVVA